MAATDSADDMTLLLDHKDLTPPIPRLFFLGSTVYAESSS